MIDEMPLWGWIALALWTILPISSVILGLLGINVLFIGILLVFWLFLPGIGPLVYSATWANLVIYRILHGRGIATSAPMTFDNQNGASAWLSLLGIIGAIRSGFSIEAFVGILLGLLGAGVLHFCQGWIFRPYSNAYAEGPVLSEEIRKRIAEEFLRTNRQLVMDVFPSLFESVQTKQLEGIIDKFYGEVSRLRAPRSPWGDETFNELFSTLTISSLMESMSKSESDPKKAKLIVALVDFAFGVLVQSKSIGKDAGT